MIAVSCDTSSVPSESACYVHKPYCGYFVGRPSTLRVMTKDLRIRDCQASNVKAQNQMIYRNHDCNERLVRIGVGIA